jgi:molybdopterin converting factor small subunit
VISVRLFAAAREAAGTDHAQFACASVAELHEQMTDRFGARMTQVLSACSMLSDGSRLGPADALPDGSEVDVLPPFAGG